MSVATIKNSSSFRDGWVAFMRTLASSHKIQFVFGQKPQTNGSTIWLPSLPLDLSGEDAAIVRGDAFHELGHLKFTNFDVGNQLYKEEGQFAFSLLNAIEDPWMEQRAKALSRIAEHYLRLSASLYYQRNKENYFSMTLDDSYVTFVLCFYFSQLMGWSEYDELMTISESIVIDKFEEGGDYVLNATREILQEEALNCTSTKDNAQLTLRIMAMLRDMNFFPPQDSEPDTSGEEESGDKGPDHEDEGSSSEGKSNDDAQGSDDKESVIGDDDSSEASFTDKIKSMLLGHGLDGSEVVDLRGAVCGISTDAQYKGSPVIPDGTFIGSGASDGEELTRLTIAPKNEENYKTLIENLERKTSVLLYKLQSFLLQASEEAEAVIGTSGKRLACGKLHRLSQGNLAIFSSTVEREVTTPTVSFLCDLSGSTVGGTLDVAIYQSAYLFSSALNLMGIPYEILGFGDKEMSMLSVVKSFDEGFEQSKYRLGGFTEIAGGGTPMLEATFQASMRSLAFGGDRNVIFILTDGEPFDKDQTAMHAQQLEQSDVELVYVLVGGSASSDWLHDAGLKYIKITDLQDLQPAILDQIKTLLI